MCWVSLFSNYTQMLKILSYDTKSSWIKCDYHEMTANEITHSSKRGDV